MRLDDYEILGVLPEPGVYNYRLKHRRTGSLFFVHVFPDGERVAADLRSKLNRMPSAERARIVDQGKEGTLSWFLTEGLPEDTGFMSWLAEISDGRPRSVQNAKPALLREIFDEAAELPAHERTALVLRRCGDDRATAEKVLAMLRSIDQADEFLEVPAARQIADDELAPVESAAGEPEFAPGSCIGGRYIVDGVVGRGGFGVIYGARDRQVHNRRVVLKVRREDAGQLNPDLMKRFSREAESLARITHPSVVGVLDVGQTERGTPYFVMQHVPGRTLRQKLREEGPLPLPRIANIVRQVSHALSVTHKEGICHRDLKPENVMLQDLGDGEELAIIIDFGIATMKEISQTRALLTRAVGTLAYMPPEQREGWPLPASDTFALGVMTWEMISGSLPGKAGNAGVSRCPRRRRKEVERSILKAMSPDHRARHTRTRDFGDEVWAALQPALPPRRNWVSDALAAVLAALCIVLAWVILHTRTAPIPSASGIVYKWSQRENPKGYRLHLSGQRPGTFYLIEETAPGRFKILLPNLSYLTPSARYLGVMYVDFPPGRAWWPAEMSRSAGNLWAFLAKDRVTAIDALARSERAAGPEASEGVAGPDLDSLLTNVRRTGGGVISDKLAAELVHLPAE